MNNCVICGKESESECCSGACRAKKSRQQRSLGPAGEIEAHAHDMRTDEGRTVEAHAVSEQPLIENFGESDCECTDCKLNRLNGNHHVINHGDWKPAVELGPSELNRVTLPGDPDYKAKCKATTEYNTDVSQIRLEVA